MSLGGTVTVEIGDNPDMWVTQTTGFTINFRLTDRRVGPQFDFEITVPSGVRTKVVADGKSSS